VSALLGALVNHALQILAVKVYSKRNNGHVKPEAHLLVVWVATPIMVVGIVMVGVSLHHRYHYMALAAVWALYVSGIIMVTTAMNAYCLASYPELADEVVAWINEGRILGGFIVNYFELKWVKAMGAEKALGIINVFQLFGQRLRLEKAQPRL